VSSPNDEAAVILVGDAVHCFPPDLGEGVNSGLEDVLELDKSLKEHASLGEAAEAYGRERGIEVRLLAILLSHVYLYTRTQPRY